MSILPPNRRRAEAQTSEGFTLLETLVAFLVLSIATGVSMQIVNSGYLKIRKSNEFSQVLNLANRLRGLELQGGRENFPKSGTTEQGLSWRIEPVLLEEGAPPHSESMIRLFKLEIGGKSSGGSRYKFIFVPNTR